MAAIGSLCRWSHRRGHRLGRHAGLGPRAPTLSRIDGGVDQMRRKNCGSSQEVRYAARQQFDH